MGISKQLPKDRSDFLFRFFSSKTGPSDFPIISFSVLDRLIEVVGDLLLVSLSSLTSFGRALNRAEAAS